MSNVYLFLDFSNIEKFSPVYVSATSKLIDSTLQSKQTGVLTVVVHEQKPGNYSVCLSGQFF